MLTSNDIDQIETGHHGDIADVRQLCADWRDHDSEIDRLEARVAELEQKYDELNQVYLRANAAVGKEYQDRLALVEEVGKLKQALAFNPQAAKLIQNGKPFLVVAVDEPYFPETYIKIANSEQAKGTWTVEDQLLMARMLTMHYFPEGRPE